jgi:hypothetical protein
MSNQEGLIVKRLISILLIALLFACSMYAAAEIEDESLGDIELFYVYAKNVTANLAIDSGGIATSRGLITLRDSSYTATITVKLQKKNGRSWTTIATWSDFGNGYAGASAGGTRQVTSGYSYRVSVTAVVKDSSGNVIERPSKDSAVKAY